MGTIFIILLLFLGKFSFAQQAFTSEQIDRFADAGKVYGYIRYFNPYVQYADVNWDSTFAANAEGIINSRNKEEYASAMQHLLATLNDDITVVANLHPIGNYRVQSTAYSIKDSILYISLNDITDESYNKVQEGLGKIREVKEVVFDMRKPVNSSHNYYAGSGTVLDWWSENLYRGDLIMPSFRSIVYDNLPTPKFGYVLGANFKVSTLYKAYGTAIRELPLVFIVKNSDEVPSFAMSLQQRGKAAIVSEQGGKLLIGKTTSFYIADSVLIKMRLSEGLNDDGSLAIVHPDATYSSPDPDEALIRAGELIRAGLSIQPAHPVKAPLLIFHPSKYNSSGSYPFLGYRLLAASKIYSTIDHFYPFKNLMDNNWQECYRKNLSNFIEARDSLDFMRAVAELYSNIRDSHGFISISTDQFSLRLNPVIQGRGGYVPPVTTQLIQNKLIITGIYNDSVCSRIGLNKGDIILSVEGKDPIELIESARKYQCASTRASQTFFVSNFILFGNKGEIKELKVQHADGDIMNVDMPILQKFEGSWWNDPYWLKVIARHNNPTYNLVSNGIGYADLTSPLQQKDFDSIFNQFKRTKAIIFDLRGYPHFNGSPFKNLLQNPDALLAKISNPKPSSPDIEEAVYSEMTRVEDIRNSFQTSVNWAPPGSEVYKGKIAVLMNESNQSAAEHICLVLKAICNATLVGSVTSGTNGGLVEFDIPGNLILWFSGQEASFPDGTRTQRTGIKPDIAVYPTIKGIQTGKDEVLERAIGYLQTGK